MTDNDFLTCKFIKEELSYLTYYDFCDNCKIIKHFFNNLSTNGKIFYKWYVYSNIHMKEYFKDTIWDYLNFNDEEYYERLLELKKQYRAR